MSFIIFPIRLIENNIIGSNSVYVGAGGTILLDADILNQVYSEVRKGKK